MDFTAHFHREVVAFEAAVRRAAEAGAAPLVPSCPGWSVSDLVLHLGGVQHALAYLIENRLQEPPDAGDLAGHGHDDWPVPERAPNRGAVPPSLIEWFADGAAALESLLRDGDHGAAVWTWSRERTIGFWARMQTIEAAVHRWDAESAIGAARPVEAELAGDAIAQTFEVMAPARRAWKKAPPGSGERFRIRQTDGTGAWTVHFEGDDVRLAGDAGPCDVELAGTASDLMLFLWRRIGADELRVTGDRDALDRYFVLVPPV